MTSKTALPNVIVIGGCGFLGHHIVNLLLQQHPEAAISVLDLHTNHNRAPNVQYFNGDITKPEDVRAAYRGSKAQVVINTVSPVAATASAMAKEIYYKVNVEGTKTLLEAAAQEKIPVFVYTSSAGVVTDNINDLINVDETYPINPSNPDAYSDSKAKGEEIVTAFNGKGGVNTCSLRVAGLFGPGDRQMLPGMLSVLKNNQTKFQLGTNDNLFDFTYIENAAYAHILAAERMVHQLSSPPSNPAQKVAGQVFFITNGEPVYFWDFPRAVWAMYGGHVAPYHIKFGKGLGHTLAWAAEWYAWLVKKEPGFTRFRVNYATSQRYFNIKKARDLLGYRTLYSLHDGLEKSVKWFKEQEAATEQKKGQ